jgi:hypothetical protein
MSDPLEFFTFAGQRRYLRIALFLGKWLMRLMSASVEAYLRANFGRRYVNMLAGAFFFFFVCTGLNPAPAAFTSLFLLGLFVMVVRHVLQVFRRRRLSATEPHSASAGESWVVWQRFGLAPATVQRYLEPLLCWIIGLIISPADPFLGFWLKASAVALLIKEQFNRVRITRRIIDANDAKVSAQSLNTGMRQYQQGPGQAAQKSHRAHFPSRIQRPRP